MNATRPLAITLLLMGLLSTANAQEESSKAQNEAKPQSIDELLLFFTAKYPSGDWQPKDLRFDDVYFTADDKTQLHGWYCPCDNPRAVILLSHGNASHVASRAPWLRYLQSNAKVSIFIFDYRGYGAARVLQLLTVLSKMHELLGLNCANSRPLKIPKYSLWENCLEVQS